VKVKVLFDQFADVMDSRAGRFWLIIVIGLSGETAVEPALSLGGVGGC
jgi:hypothetical protein